MANSNDVDTERKKEDEAYDYVKRTFLTSHIDNSKPLRVLFNDDPQALYDCHTKRRVCS